jgi:hypothetical protein
MKRISIVIVIFMLLSITTAFAEKAKTNDALALENKSVLRISAFVAAGDVVEFLGTKEKLAEAVEILKSLGVTHVFLDTYRGMIPDRNILTQARDYFKSNGFDVGAGITTVQGKEFGVPSPTHRYFLCYDNEKTRNDMKMISEYAASMFEEIIVDDFFATDCRCKECAATKGDRTWDQYFRDVLVGISSNQLVGAAHAQNGKVNVIIKYPQWYDRFHTFGYDLSRQPEIFDNVWAGTETRDPEKENVMQYQAFSNYTWIKSIAGDKLRGGWFDFYNTSPETFVEQAYQTVLAGAPEITLFGFRPDIFKGADYQLFAEKLPFLFKAAKAINGLRGTGVFAYKPINSSATGENYVFDYLGMLGIPVLPTSKYPENSKTVILTEHAAADPGIVDKIKATASTGGTVLITSGLIERLKKNDEILKMAGLNPAIKRMKGKFANSYVTETGESKGPGYIEVGVRIAANDAKVLAYAVIDKEKFPILTSRETPEGGKVVVFNATTFSFPSDTDGLNIPYSVLYINLLDKVAGLIRDFATEPLGLSLTMPTRMGTYLFDNRYIAIENFNNSPTDISVKFDQKIFGCEMKSLTDVYDGGTTSPGNNGVFSMIIPLRSLHLYKMDYKNGCIPKSADGK